MFRTISIVLLIANWVVTTTPVYAAESFTLDKQSVVIQRVNLDTGKASFYQMKAKDALNSKGAFRLPAEQLEAMVAKAEPIPQDQIQAWKSDHESDLSSGLQATITLLNGDTVPLKNFQQMVQEIKKVAPEGKVAKQLKWMTEHEGDLSSGKQSWFWLGFAIGGLAVAGLAYACAPHYYYGAYYAPAYYASGYYAPSYYPYYGYYGYNSYAPYWGGGFYYRYW